MKARMVHFVLMKVSKKCTDPRQAEKDFTNTPQTIKHISSTASKKSRTSRLQDSRNTFPSHKTSENKTLWKTNFKIYARKTLLFQRIIEGLSFDLKKTPKNAQGPQFSERGYFVTFLFLRTHKNFDGVRNSNPRTPALQTRVKH